MKQEHAHTKLQYKNNLKPQIVAVLLEKKKTDYQQDSLTLNKGKWKGKSKTMMLRENKRKHKGKSGE